MQGFKYVEWKKEVEEAFINYAGVSVQESITGTILYQYFKLGYDPIDVVKEISQKIDAYGIY
jgi:hypothetical protein